MTKNEDADYIGKHGLDLINRSPLHFWERYINPKHIEKPPSPAFIFGSLLHCIVLEQDKFEQRYAVTPEGMNKRKKEWELFKEEHADKTIVSFDDLQTAESMKQAIYQHEDAANLLNFGVAEKSVYGFDPVTGVLCRAKPDFHNTQRNFYVDVKTTTDGSADSFARDVANYRYHVQDAYYTDVAMWAGEPIKGFAFIAVEKEPPYAVAVYVLDDDSREMGRIAYRPNLNTYAECLKSGIWHGYGDGAKSLRLPRWAFRT